MASQNLRALVVVAHPSVESLSRTLGERAAAALRAKGHTVEVIDLYEQDFDPRLTVGERETYHADAFESDGLHSQLDALKAANLLVLVHPVWWGGMPAIMKGWLDRVFAPGTAFQQPTDTQPLAPLLTELREVVLVSTWGTPWWVDWVLLRRSLRTTIAWGLLGTCARKSRLTYLPMYKADNAPNEAVDRFSRRMIAHLNTI